jgi:hypothetical protein
MWFSDGVLDVAMIFLTLALYVSCILYQYAI